MTEATPAKTRSDTPSREPPRIGVLLANLGTPDGYDYWSVRRYLGEFLSDKRVIDLPSWKWQPILQGIVLTRRPFRAGADYRKIWNTARNESPLLTITRDQAAAVAAALHERHGEERVMVDFCMRYGNPSTRAAVRRMVAAGCSRILFLPLYPQYAAATTGTANDHFFRALMEERSQPAVRTAPAYYDHPLYIEALALSVERALAALPARPDVIVASYHGLPERFVALGDPYRDHCLATSAALRRRLGRDEDGFQTTFQSVFGREEWLRPYTVRHVAELARQGRRRMAILAPGFAADCIETLEEIKGEIRDAFMAAGGEEFTYVPCLNDDPAHVAALVAVIGENLSGWL